MANGYEVARAVVTIIPSLAGAQKTITKELTGATESAADASGATAGSKFTSSFGNALKKIGAVAATAFKAVSDAVIKTGKDAVLAYADYEQLVGGVDTLFKNSSSKVQEYANKAFMTAGVSANQYMQTVTSFSASLLQSLGGDTEKAAKIADMAMVDMSDNANKMGTDMSAIQSAYQGFAKQNYTMLDNLKLGYGGTKSEMERLLKDAQKLSGVRYDINNLSDVYNAIHVIQTEMGITGTTAKEAMTTISGSANATKAAWQNVLVTIAKGGPDLKRAVDDLLKAVFGGPDGGGLLNNIIPVVETTIKGVGQFIATAAPKILPRIRELISNILPGLIQATASILSAITDQLPLLVQSVTEIIPDIIEALTKLIPQLAVSGLEIIKAILKGILDNIDKLLAAASTIIQELMKYLSANLPEILKIGAEIILKLAGGIVQNAPQLIKSAVTAVGEFLSGIIGKLPEVLSTGGAIVTNLLTGISANMPGIIDAFSNAMSKIVGKIVEAFPEVSDGIAKIVTACRPIMDTVATNFTKVADIIAKAVVDIVKALAPYVPAISEMVTKTVEKLPAIVREFKGIVSSIGNTITNIVKAIAPYIPAITHMWEVVVENFPAIIREFKNLLSEVRSIIYAIVDLVQAIGDAVVEIVDSVGTNLALIVDAFCGFNESLETPIKAVGDAISGMIGAISNGIVAVNDSISRILDKLSKVFDSIGAAAVKAGEGFKTVADAAISLANNTSIIDLAATLAAVAGGIKSINNEAKISADRDVGGTLTNMGAGLMALVNGAKGVTSTTMMVSLLSAAMQKLNDQATGEAASNLNNFGLAITDLAENAGNSFSAIGSGADAALARLNNLAISGATSMQYLAASIRAALTGEAADFKSQFANMEKQTASSMSNIDKSVISGMNTLGAWTKAGLNNMAWYFNYDMNSSANAAAGAFNSISKSAQNAMNASGTSVVNKLTWMQSYFRGTQFVLGSKISTPHFSLSGSFNLEKGTVPTVGIKWYDKGGIFDSPTVIGVGEKRPEFVGALDDLREIVREESNTANVVINVYGSEGQNVRELASIVMQRIQQNVERQEAAFA